MSNKIEITINELMKRGMTALASVISDAFADSGEDEANKVIKEKVGIDLSTVANEDEIKMEIDNNIYKITEEDIALAEIEKEKAIAEMENMVRLREIELEQFKEENKDIQDSRDTSIELRKTGKNFFERNVTHIFAFMGIVVIFSIVASLIFVQIPEENQKYADIILGTLLALATNVFNHYFGHTKSSGDKTAMIEKELESKGR